MDLAPIILFVYNRPEHTLQTLQALKENVLSNQSKLIIYADGAKANVTQVEKEKIQETRQVLRQEAWCQTVKIVESDTNKGLADSIVLGVTEVVEQYGKVIVLEDDIVTSPGFLQYMNDALEFYKNEEQVMHISGYFPPVKSPRDLSETFFYPQASCWGWATWDRAWKYFNTDAKELLTEIKNRGLEYSFNMDDTYPFLNHLESNVNGSMKTWAIKWYASTFLKDGLCLHPRLSLVRNMGFDGSGVHGGVSQAMAKQEIANHVNIEKIPLENSVQARTKIKEFNTRPKVPQKPSLKSRVKQYIKRKLKARFGGT